MIKFLLWFLVLVHREAKRKPHGFYEYSKPSCTNLIKNALMSIGVTKDSCRLGN